MTHRSIIARTAVAAAAGATVLAGLAAPTFASAQGYYDSRGGAYYDPCRREKTNRGVAGALIGGALGAVIGSNAAAGGVRTEGSLLGGALGAGVGAAVGNSSAACDSYRSGYYDSGYDGRYGDYRYPARRYEQGYAYENYGPGRDSWDRDYYPANRPTADGCTLAESPIYLPDGRVEQRFVRVCEGPNGRYQVVD